MREAAGCDMPTACAAALTMPVSAIAAIRRRWLSFSRPPAVSAAPSPRSSRPAGVASDFSLIERDFPGRDFPPRRRRVNLYQNCMANARIRI